MPGTGQKMALTKIAGGQTSAHQAAYSPGGFEQSLRDQLIMEHMPVVTSIAQRMLTKLPSSVEADDIYSVGIIGLIDAAERFDAKRAIKFRTYAEVRIKGAMLDYLRSLSWAPRRLHRQVRELNQARTTIEGTNGRNATINELADAMGVTVEQYHLLMLEINSIDLRNSDEQAEEDSNRSAQFVAGPASDPSTELERKEMIEIVRQAAEQLTERQRVLLWLYYHEELTMKEVGAVLEVKESRASQIHSKTLKTLQSEVLKIVNPRMNCPEA
jgi:RNA polymerase sigma factor for flagellar operon FliA